MTQDAPPKPRPAPWRTWAARAILLAMGLLVGLLASEVLLRIAGLPRAYRRHSRAAQFEPIGVMRDRWPVYVNLRSTNITFVYDGDPLGRLGPGQRVEHLTNSRGFRGPEWGDPRPGEVLRIACLGDSFTFGEGVRFEETYAERTAALLRARPGVAARYGGVEALNFGVGGYNTEQALDALERFVLPSRPDVVVLGYVLNDAEPPIFSVQPESGAIGRRDRGREVPEGLADPRPPESWVYKLRTASLVWRFFANRARTAATIEHYQRINREDQEGWQRSMAALRAMAALCRERRIPFVVVVFPILVGLEGQYPFEEIHARLEGVLAAEKVARVDLLPALKGTRSQELWVHPTDQHPNERVHALAAGALAELIGKGVEAAARR